MKVNELRIGNLVKVTKRGGYNNIGDVIDVRSINRNYGVNEWQDMGASGCNPFDGIEGIPLTEEWLVKLGFDKWLSETNEGCSYYKLGILNLMNSDSLSYGCSFDPENQNSWFTEIKFVHQLQNLYFDLTGEELSIEQ